MRSPSVALQAGATSTATIALPRLCQLRPQRRATEITVIVATRHVELEFVRRALDLALAWPEHGETTLCDVIEHLDESSDQDQSRVWNLIDSWADTESLLPAGTGSPRRSVQSSSFACSGTASARSVPRDGPAKQERRDIGPETCAVSRRRRQ